MSNDLLGPAEIFNCLLSLIEVYIFLKRSFLVQHLFLCHTVGELLQRQSEV